MPGGPSYSAARQPSNSRLETQDCKDRAGRIAIFTHCSIAQSLEISQDCSGNIMYHTLAWQVSRNRTGGRTRRPCADWNGALNKIPRRRPSTTGHPARNNILSFDVRPRNWALTRRRVLSWRENGQSVHVDERRVLALRTIVKWWCYEIGSELLKRKTCYGSESRKWHL